MFKNKIDYFLIAFLDIARLYRLSRAAVSQIVQDNFTAK